MVRYQENKRLSKDPERKRLKEIYEIKQITKEEQQERLKKAYAHIYYEAFGAAITTEKLKSLEGIEE
jgi:tryptophanase